MNSPNAAAAPLTLHLPGTPTGSGAGPAPTSVVAMSPYDTSTLLFTDPTTFDGGPEPQPADPLADALRLQQHAAEPANTTSTLERATSIGSMPSSQVARTVIQTKGAEYGMPRSYIETALRAQDLAAAIEQDMERMSEQITLQMFSSSGGGAMDILQSLQLLDQRASQLVRLQEHLRDNFLLARRDPAFATSQLEQWLAGVHGS
jgi:hypothetical protein